MKIIKTKEEKEAEAKKQEEKAQMDQLALDKEPSVNKLKLNVGIMIKK